MLPKFWTKPFSQHVVLRVCALWCSATTSPKWPRRQVNWKRHLVWCFLPTKPESQHSSFVTCLFSLSIIQQNTFLKKGWISSISTFTDPANSCCCWTLTSTSDWMNNSDHKALGPYLKCSLAQGDPVTHCLNKHRLQRHTHTYWQTYTHRFLWRRRLEVSRSDNKESLQSFALFWKWFSTFYSFCAFIPYLFQGDCENRRKRLFYLNLILW